jgi:hypothetical protein
MERSDQGLQRELHTYQRHDLHWRRHHALDRANQRHRLEASLMRRPMGQVD